MSYSHLTGERRNLSRIVQRNYTELVGHWFRHAGFMILVVEDELKRKYCWRRQRLDPEADWSGLWEVVGSGWEELGDLTKPVSTFACTGNVQMYNSR